LEKNLTPQAFSFPTVGKNNMIYVPPYGLKERIDYMIKVDPVTFNVTKIYLEVDESFEKWQYGTIVDNFIVFLPYNECSILIVNTDNDEITQIKLPFNSPGKYIASHRYKNKVIALPYGEHKEFDFAISFDVYTKELLLKNIVCPINDQKKWHTSKLINNFIYGVPRGERYIEPYFPYIIKLDCETFNYELTDMSHAWKEYDVQPFPIITNKKYTTMAQVGNKLYAPPYSENDNFDIMLKFNGTSWSYEKTGMQDTSRKYFSHAVSKNGKAYFPPAGHEDSWNKMLIIDSNNDTWKQVPVDGVGYESKKYFTGWENTQGKIYWIPRGGCVCEPEENWKQQGDLADILVVDTTNDSFYTIDISEYFKDNTTIEKFNSSVIIDDKIFAFPYGQSETFHTVLVFDTISETVIKEINLNEV
jgi:hypothetical protein